MVISLAGEWDIYRAPELRERLDPAYREPQVILDLTTAKYITSSLISALVSANKHREAHGLARAVLVVHSAFVRRLLTLTGLDELFPIYESMGDALARTGSLEARDAVG